MDFLFPGKPKRASSSSNLRYQIKDDEQYGPNSKLIYRGRIINRQNPFPAELFTFSHLQVLDLSSKGNDFSVCVLDSIPLELFRLRNLKVLSIDNHNIRKIPNEITTLTKLEVLSLNKNKIPKIPFSFSSLVTLKHLHISNNSFETFPETICQLKSLLLLDISFNKIKQLPKDLKELSLIETLNLSDNKIDELPTGLCYCTNLKCLSLSNNNLRSLPNEFSQLTRLDWNRNSTLSSNCLSGNPLEYPSLDKIGSLGLIGIFKFLENKTIKEYTKEEEREETNKIRSNLVSKSSNNLTLIPENLINKEKTYIVPEIRIPTLLVATDLDDKDDLDN